MAKRLLPTNAKCGAKTRKGKPCPMPAGWATNHPGFGHCKVHGGNHRSGEIAAQREMARFACARLHIPYEGIRPDEALNSALEHAYGEVMWVREQLELLPAHPGEDRPVGDAKGKGAPKFIPGEAGVYGRTYHITGMPTGDYAVHALVRLYHEAWDRVTKISSEMIRLNLAERGVRIAEREGVALFRAIELSFRAMGLGLEEFERFRAILADNLAAMNGQRPKSRAIPLRRPDELPAPTNGKPEVIDAA